MPNYGYLLPTRGTVLSSDDATELTARTQSDVIGLSERAEAMGFESVWTGDSVLAKPRLDALSTLAAVATATDAVGLGTAVHLPTLRHPATVAHRTATVDQLSGGRLRYGVGVGIGPDVEAEYRNLEITYDRRGARLNELLDAVTSLWTGDPVDHSGDFYDLDGASIGFEPSAEPPVYVASAAFDPTDGFPKSIEKRIVEYGSGWLPTAMDPETYEAGLSEIRSLLEEAGRSPTDFHTAVYHDVVIDDDEARAVEEAQRFYDKYYPAWGELSAEQVERRGTFGPVERVEEVVEAYVEAGVKTVVVRFTARDQRQQLSRFREVL